MEQELSAQDREHVRLLSIFHYVVGGIEGLFALFPILHLVMGVLLVSGNLGPSGEAAEQMPSHMVGWFFVWFASALIVFGLAVAVCTFVAGRFLADYRRRTFCLIVAGVNCLSVPFGTILGVFTFVVLSRPQVRAAFEVQPVDLSGHPYRTEDAGSHEAAGAESQHTRQGDLHDR